ncbi:helix-turn-helix domain-containing protein [Actinoplanes sichuanensis]|uniref:XRE family transcriptional regulator n=1 Tax=Actinoplanes sichuanensis TaxID=512349 RepID=A0ABW4A772_9ACTN|nr:XRE family transcriptional regulator [Actinoplanes sichuanensis]BEL03550.1 helix-turn-helix domain-containing protein [Actinoplanes sichuanensis]
MQPGVPESARLARRLRSLRTEHWPDLKVTQHQIAEALGGENGPLSLSLISSWESLRNPALPPASRLAGYAMFFATRRSVESSPARLLSEHDLSDDERQERDRLHSELFGMRFVDGESTEPEPAGSTLAGLDPGVAGSGTWFFPDQRPIVIVSGSLPKRFRERMPFTDTKDPDYVRSYSLADLDALLEVHGHIRAVNPAAEVRICRSEEMEEDDFTSHLVLIGGVDWNAVNRDIARRLDLPVRQRDRPHDEDAGCFSAGAGQIFEPLLDPSNGMLLEDVAHFFRGKSPYNSRRTVTLCNGMYGRGTYGAVRALTDAKFRDRNENFIRQRFPDVSAFSILMRVRINPNGTVVTPDWTQDDERLHEWPSVIEA